MAEKKRSLELKKHVATIHSSNKLSLLQRKIANALLFNAYDKLLKESEHQIHIATLCKLIGYDSHDYKTIKKALVNLLATVIEWNLVDKEKLTNPSVWNASSIIADASIEGPICTYSYSNKMKQLLHRPELYGRLNMLVQAKFQSSYGLALYENCVRYQNIDQTPWFDIEQFRKLMGVEPGKYKIFRDFKNRVLEKAIQEVNRYSAIEVVPEFKKQGRKVIAIQFGIRTNKPTRLTQIVKEKPTLSGYLKERFALSKKQQEDVLTDYDEEYIREKIKLIEDSASFKRGKIKNVAKYLLSALKDDYQTPRASMEIIEAKPVEQVNSTKHDPALAEAYRRFQNKELMNLFNQENDVSKKNILQEFKKFLGKSIYRDIYLRDGLENILIQDQLCLYIREHRTEFLKQVIPYKKFLTRMKVKAT